MLPAPLTVRLQDLRLLIWAALLPALLYAVLFDQGLLTAGLPLLHELFHDGRHLLGVPCH